MKARRESAAAKQREDETRRSDLLRSRPVGDDATKQRSVAEAQEEIDVYKKETGASLDRTIALLQESKVAAHGASEQLESQTQVLKSTRKTLAQTDQTLNDTKYKLKYKFSWMGVTKGMFASGPKKSEEVAALEAAGISPGGTTRPKSRTAAPSPASAAAAASATAGGPRNSRAAAGPRLPAAPAFGSAERSGGGGRSEVVSEYGDQLDTIDDLLSNLAVEARQMNQRLAEQAPDVEALHNGTAVAKDKAKHQNSKMRKRWNMK